MDSYDPKTQRWSNDGDFQMWENAKMVLAFFGTIGLVIAAVVYLVAALASVFLG